jgi:hypothetical protein
MAQRKLLQLPQLKIRQFLATNQLDPYNPKVKRGRS